MTNDYKFVLLGISIAWLDLFPVFFFFDLTEYEMWWSHFAITKLTCVIILHNSNCQLSVKTFFNMNANDCDFFLWNTRRYERLRHTRVIIARGFLSAQLQTDDDGSKFILVPRDYACGSRRALQRRKRPLHIHQSLWFSATAEIAPRNLNFYMKAKVKEGKITLSKPSIF